MGEHRGIETIYRGARFRSRTEARWAAFFDELEWPWDYEPIDLAGYIPDFVLKLPHGAVLVEVKSDVHFDQLEAHAEKIESSGWTGESLIVGAHPNLAGGFDYGLPILGLMSERIEDGAAWGEGNLHWCAKCDRPSFHHAIHRWHCRVSGCYDGDGFLREFDWEPMWNRAASQVQWRPGKSNG